MLLITVPDSGDVVFGMYGGSFIMARYYIRSPRRCWSLGRLDTFINKLQEIGSVGVPVEPRVFDTRFKTNPTVALMVTRAEISMSKAFMDIAARGKLFGRSPLNSFKIDLGETGLMLYFNFRHGTYVQHIPIGNLGKFFVFAEKMTDVVNKEISANIWLS